MEKFKIEENVPIPYVSVVDGTKFPLAKMKIGNSFCIHTDDYREITKFRYCVSAWGSRHEMKFTVRKVSPTETRCWRIK